jgi:PIN domain nuclease of toxin-antitoxin system
VRNFSEGAALPSLSKLAQTGLALPRETRSGSPWHHRDPFDRLLVAQALERGYAIVTRDPVFASYGVAVVAA